MKQIVASYMSHDLFSNSPTFRLTPSVNVSLSNKICKKSFKLVDKDEDFRILTGPYKSFYAKIYDRWCCGTPDIPSIILKQNNYNRKNINEFYIVRCNDNRFLLLNNLRLRRFQEIFKEYRLDARQYIFNIKSNLLNTDLTLTCKETDEPASFSESINDDFIKEHFYTFDEYSQTEEYKTLSTIENIIR